MSFLSMDRRKLLLKILGVAECAAAQLLSLKDSLHNEFNVCHSFIHSFILNILRHLDL